MSKHAGWSPSGFGAALKRERERIGMSREQLAVTAGCAFMTITKLENGYQEPAWPLALSIAKALGVGIEVLADVTPEEARATARPKGRPPRGEAVGEPPPSATKPRPGRPRKGT